MKTIKIPREFNLDYKTTNDFLSQVDSIDLSSLDKDVILDFGENIWFNAELTTFLGAIIARLNNNGFKVYISKLSNRVELILQKNGFLTAYGLKNDADDTYKTTIPFYIVPAKSIKEIDQYLEVKVFSKISELRKNTITPSDIELMENAVYEVVHNITDHSESSHVIMCGQYYPSKERVVFTIADIGVSLPKKVTENMDHLISDLECIDWAVKKGNSTKTIQSSGLGLYDISSQLRKSGTLHIISRDAYWMMERGGLSFKKNLDNSFFGTLINLDFHLDASDNSEDVDDIIDIFF